MTSHKPLHLVIVLGACLLATGCVTVGGGRNTTNDNSNSSEVSAPVELLAALEGGLVGRAQGDQMPRADRLLALQNEYRALEYTAPGEAVLWQGKNLNGRIIPSQPYRVGSQDCRQYEHTIIDRATESTVRGTACRNENGSWTLLS